MIPSLTIKLKYTTYVERKNETLWHSNLITKLSDLKIRDMSRVELFGEICVTIANNQRDRMKSTPKCRYDSCNLEKVTGPSAIKSWASIGMVEDENNPEQARLGFNSAFSYSAFKCPLCGYVELFDEGE